MFPCPSHQIDSSTPKTRSKGKAWREEKGQGQWGLGRQEVNIERGGRQGPTGDGGGMMADIFVLKYFCIYLNDTRATGAFRERSYVIGLAFY